jgi:hypothetical protein
MRTEKVLHAVWTGELVTLWTEAVAALGQASPNTAAAAAAIEVVDMAERLLARVARMRLVFKLGEHPLYECKEDNIAVLSVGNASEGSVRADCLVFPGVMIQRRQWIQKGRSADGYQTLCTMAVEADGTFSIEVPAARRVFVGATEEDVCAQVTAAGIWAEWTRADGSDSACIDFGLQLPAVQALMATALTGDVVDAPSPAKRARTATPKTTTPSSSASPPPLQSPQPLSPCALSAFSVVCTSAAGSAERGEDVDTTFSATWAACLPRTSKTPARVRPSPRSPSANSCAIPTPSACKLVVVRAATGRAEVMAVPSDTHAPFVVLRRRGG